MNINLNLRNILILVAVILFVLAGISFEVGSIGLVPIGLAFFAAAHWG